MRTMSRRGMVASPQYLASEAGINVLRRGGNALDAAIATNAVLAVVMPYMCGLGGDLFAMVYTAEDGALTGLNGSGRAPAEATLERVRTLAGAEQMPARGPLPITVPGCVEAWGRLHERFGHLPFPDLLADAIHYAEYGFPVTAAFAGAIAASAPFLHAGTPAPETYLPGGKAPIEGEVFFQTRLATTLRAIAQEGAGAYYRGPVAGEIVRAVRSAGGLLSETDLGGHTSTWVQPLSIRYRDVDVYELPPNSQGIIALQMLNILRQLPRDTIAGSGAAYIHLLSEVARLAYADREAYLTDPEHMKVAPSTLLREEYASARASQLGELATPEAKAGSPGDTIYLCTADSAGNCVSLIQSNFMGFGSGIMGGETGVMLQNRGAWFSLHPEHPNRIAPGKRTLHTLMPAMALREGRPWLVFGTMGGSMQAQIHVELLTRLIDQGLPLDVAINAPRFDAVAGAAPDGRPALLVEDRFSPEVIEDLEQRGHSVQRLQPYASAVGHAHAIRILENSVYVGAADPRADSLALGY